MKIFALLCLAASALAYPTAAPTNTTSGNSTDPKALLAQLQTTYETNTQALLTKTHCNKYNMRIRKSYSALSQYERLDYLKSVKCLITKRPHLDAYDRTIPGIKSRTDEFTYAHLNQTNFMHVSGLFLPWHRQFMWAYEEALRNECGYKGAVPYWDWAEFSDDQSKSPIFDGSETSFGSNGEAIPHGVQSGVIPGILLNGTFPFPVTRDPGTGGGCVTDGYFKNMTVHLGPVVPANNTQDNLYGEKDNPRCLKRDFDNRVSQASLNPSAVAALMQSPDIHAFRPSMDANMHPSSHRFGGGDIFDLFTSPNDPVFYLLHSQIDRLWTVWQGQDYKTRQDALDGTVTFLNQPPSANATLDTVMIMGTAGGNVKVGEAMSAIGGRYCYMYQ